MCVCVCMCVYFTRQMCDGSGEDTILPWALLGRTTHPQEISR